MVIPCSTCQHIKPKPMSGRGLSKVNCVAPGPTETDILARAGFTDEMIEQSNTDMEELLPLGRRGRADEIADMVAKICEPSVSWFTGQVISVDGGMSIT